MAIDSTAGAYAQLTQAASQATEITTAVSAAMTPIGMKIFAVLATITIMWAGFKTLLESMGNNLGTGEAFQEAYTAIFWACIIYWLAIGPGYQIVFVQGGLGLTNALAGAASGGAANPMEGAMGGIIETVVKMFDNALTIFTQTSALDLGGMGRSLAAFLLTAVCAFLLLIAYVIFIGVSITGQVLVNIAVAVGPVFIPFFLFRPLQQLWSGWLGFFIGSALYKVFAALILAITLPMIQQATKVTPHNIEQVKTDMNSPTLKAMRETAVKACVTGMSQSIECKRADKNLQEAEHKAEGVKVNIDIAAYIMAIIYAALAAYLMTLAPTIATQIAGGVGSDPMGALRMMGTAKGMATGGLSKLMSAPGAAKNAISGGIGKAIGAKEAAGAAGKAIQGIRNANAGSMPSRQPPAPSPN